MLFFLTICSLFYINAGFLLNGTSGTSGNGATTLDEKRFHLVMDFISEERESNRVLKQELKQMETFVNGLKSDIQSLKTELDNCKQNNSMMDSQDIENLKKEIWQLRRKTTQNDNVIKQQEQRIGDIGNDMDTLKHDLISFTNLASASQFHNSTVLQSTVYNMYAQMETIKTKVSLLTASSNSRNQDFIALLNQTNYVERKIILQDQNTHKLELEQNKTALAMKDALQKITTLNDYVALTLCKSSYSNVNGGDVVKFTSIKTAHGITDTKTITATGKFTCEKPGLYIFSVFILTNSINAQYQLYKNSERISFVYIAESKLNTGSGTVVLQLNSGDTLFVKPYANMNIFGDYSCLTIIKI